MTDKQFMTSVIGARTENGDRAKASTHNPNLDLFALEGGMRENPEDFLNLFRSAYRVDKALALKNLFYLRDIRNGLGERNLFRFGLAEVMKTDPIIGGALISKIPDYGRFDDLLVALDTKAQPALATYISSILAQDEANLAAGKPVSLLSKWLPSINASNVIARRNARKISAMLNLTYADYRKTLSRLRKGRIIENDLRLKSYAFAYAKVPSQAFFKYRKAFARNDATRFEAFMADVAGGKAKANVNTLFPYQIVRQANKQLSILEPNASYFDDLDKPDGAKAQAKAILANLNVLWNQLDRSEIPGNILVMRDGSGSMVNGSKVRPIDVATSLAILFGERLTGPFQNAFLTFSRHPKLVDFGSGSLSDKLKIAMRENEAANTDLRAALEVILKYETKKAFDKSKGLKYLVVISDMEFDENPISNLSTYDDYKAMFEKAGLIAPKIIFWDVAARSIHFPTDKNQNVVFVSGSSKAVIDAISKGAMLSAEEYMVKVLAPYSFVDAVIASSKA